MTIYLSIIKPDVAEDFNIFLFHGEVDIDLGRTDKQALSSCDVSDRLDDSALRFFVSSCRQSSPRIEHTI